MEEKWKNSALLQVQWWLWWYLRGLSNLMSAQRFQADPLGMECQYLAYTKLCFPNKKIEPGPWWWKPRILTTGPLGNSPSIPFNLFISLSWKFPSNISLPWTCNHAWWSDTPLPLSLCLSLHLVQSSEKGKLSHLWLICIFDYSWLCWVFVAAWVFLAGFLNGKKELLSSCDPMASLVAEHGP